jgi:hypothetical protein
MCLLLNLAAAAAVVPQMAATKPAGKPGVEEDLPQVHRIRITLTSRNVKNLEKGEHCWQPPLEDTAAGRM